MQTTTKPEALSKPTAETLVARARAMIPIIAGRAAAARRERRAPAETIRDMEAAGVPLSQPAKSRFPEIETWFAETRFESAIKGQEDQEFGAVWSTQRAGRRGA